MPAAKSEVKRLSVSECLASLVPGAADKGLFAQTADRFHISLENLFLAGFAVLLGRLTRQDCVQVANGNRETVQFNLDEFTTMRAIFDAMRTSSGIEPNLLLQRFPYGAELKNGGANDRSVRYEFLGRDDRPSPGMDCGLRLVVHDDGRTFELASPVRRWSQQTLISWLGYLLVLLRNACNSPDTPVQQLPMWNLDVARRFYQDLNRTEIEFPGPVTVSERFVQQAARKADSVAVISGHTKYSYRELDRLSSKLAQQLVALGAGSNRAVAVCMDRSADLLLALLAVLKSGSFYVPLEPSNPPERLRGILEECGPVVLLTDHAVGDKVQNAVGALSLTLLHIEEMKTQENATGTLPAAIDPDDLAYTIYTSGTTGKPKGVRITHRSLLNLICSVWQKLEFDESDRTLATAPISFDIATMDMFLPICSGGTLVIASRPDSMDPYRLAELMREHDITRFQATPATWRLLVNSGWNGKSNLKILCGGEAISRELADDLLRLAGQVWNCYGPTETTIWSGINQIKDGKGSVPVGPPIANTSFYVMDKVGNPLPPGVPGELYIGGKGVSPGYVARPELTAQRFVPDEFGPDPSATLFRTGDLVRLLETNELEFFGRLDHQVKLRGYRIELGEIESVLRQHASVSEAVVVLREDIPGEARLVAYVLSPEPEISASDVLNYAANYLPEYMLPSIIVRLDKFPLSTAGKVDRRSLPDPAEISSRVGSIHPAAEDPADELEQKLLKIFREVLRNKTIGVTDSFFRFGGYSLLTIRLFSKIDRELNARLPISLLFDAPTVRELARVIRIGAKPSVIVPIRPTGKSAPIFLIQSYLLYSAILEMVEPHRPVYGVREIGDGNLPVSVSDQARNFVREILGVQPTGPVYLAGWCAAAPLTVEIARQLRESGHTVGLVALFDAEHPDYSPINELGVWGGNLRKKFKYHRTRLAKISWKQRVAYFIEAMERNWEWLQDRFNALKYRTGMLLQRYFGITLPGTAFYYAQATMLADTDLPKRSYPGKLNLYRAADSPERMEADETLGWSTVAKEGVTVSFVPGDHVSMFKKPHVSFLGRCLQQEMQRNETVSAVS